MANNNMEIEIQARVGKLENLLNNGMEDFRAKNFGGIGVKSSERIDMIGLG